MKQPAKQSEEPRKVGLASEHRLPDVFKARTNEDAGTVELRKPNHRGVDVAIASFQSVANLLNTFAQDGEPSLDPGATITISDSFSGRSITITANTFVDAAAVFHAFVVKKGRYKPQTEAPSEEESGATTREEPKAKSRSKAADAAKPAATVAADERPAAVAAAKAPDKKPSPEKKAAPAEQRKGEAAATQAKPAAKKPSPAVVAETSAGGAPAVAKGSLAGFPEWAKKSLKAEYADDVWGFKLLATPVALDKENGHNVLGRDDGKAEHRGHGYELTIGGKHAGWVVAESESAFHLTGIENYETTKHRNIEPAVFIRIRRTIYPMLGHPAPEGA